MTRTLLLSSLPIEKLPTIGRNDLGGSPTVSFSKVNLSSWAAPCACPPVARPTLNAGTTIAIANRVFRMSCVSLGRTSAVDLRGKGAAPTPGWRECKMLPGESRASNEEQGQQAEEPGFSEIGSGLQRITRTCLALRNLALLDPRQAVNQWQHLARSGRAAFGLFTVVVIDDGAILLRCLEQPRAGVGFQRDREMPHRAAQLREDVALEIDIAGILWCQAHRDAQRFVEPRQSCGICCRKSVAAVFGGIDVERPQTEAHNQSHRNQHRQRGSSQLVRERAPQVKPDARSGGQRCGGDECCKDRKSVV